MVIGSEDIARIRETATNAHKNTGVQQEETDRPSTFSF